MRSNYDNLDDNLEDVRFSEQGPVEPDENDYFFIEDEPKSYPEPVIPELLSEKLPYRRRRREHISIQLINGRPIMLPAKVMAEAKDALNLLGEDNACLDSFITPETNRFTPLLNEFDLDNFYGSITDKLRRDTQLKISAWEYEDIYNYHSNELGFIIDNLPPKDRAEIDKRFLAGEQIDFSFIWGPKWKISKFESTDEKLSDAILLNQYLNYELSRNEHSLTPQEAGERLENIKEAKRIIANPDSSNNKTDSRCKIAQYSWPQSKDSLERRQFQGSNYLLFTQVTLDRSSNGVLQIKETLLSEINIGTKIGHAQTREWGKIKRDLASLTERHREGHFSLKEFEYLYNQFATLYEKSSVADRDWIIEGFTKFMRNLPNGKNYRIRRDYQGRVSFTTNESGNVIMDRELSPKEENTKYNYSVDNSIRISAPKFGILDKFLIEQSELVHRRNRSELFQHFQDNVYPAFRFNFESAAKAATEATDGLEGEQKNRWLGIFAREVASHIAGEGRKGGAQSKTKHLLAKKTNLRYLLYFLAKDADLFEHGVSGLEVVEQVLEDIATINERRLVSRVDGLAEVSRKKMVREITEMLSNKRYFRRKDKFIIEDFRVKGPKQKPSSQPRVLPSRKDDAQLFRGKYKQTNNGIERQRGNVNSFDVDPQQDIEKEIANLEEDFILYVTALANEGIMPTTYVMFEDDNIRKIYTHQIIGREIYNLARRLLQDPAARRKSSQVAVKNLFRRALTIMKNRAQKNPDLEQYLKYFDYNEVAATGRKHRNLSGMAAEVFTFLALRENPVAILGNELIEHLDLDKSQIQVIYADCMRKLSSKQDKRDYTRYLNEFNAEASNKKRTYPDFILRITNEDGKKTEVIIESKAYIKHLTKKEVTSIIENYKPYLKTRQLVIICQSPAGRINPPAWEVARNEGVRLITSETVLSALDSDKTQDQHREYSEFVGKLTSYIMNPEKQRLISDLRNELASQHFQSTGLSQEADLFNQLLQ